MAVLLAHLVATSWLAGLGWVVQLLVYPAFRLVGPTPGWGAYHAAHSRAAYAVGPPWLVQGLCDLDLLLRHPSALALVACALGAATVAATVVLALPQHAALSRSWNETAQRRLLRANLLRTLAWTAAAGVGAALLAAPPA